MASSPWKTEAQPASRTRTKAMQHRRSSLIFTDAIASCLNLCAVLRFRLNKLPLIATRRPQGSKETSSAARIKRKEPQKKRKNRQTRSATESRISLPKPSVCRSQSRRPSSPALAAVALAGGRSPRGSGEDRTTFAVRGEPAGANARIGDRKRGPPDDGGGFEGTGGDDQAANITTTTTVGTMENCFALAFSEARMSEGASPTVTPTGSRRERERDRKR